MKIRKIPAMILIALVVSGLIPNIIDVGNINSHAIIIRHDKGYTSYFANESNYPQVFYLEKQYDHKVCVATLIHPRWAVTAAHCTEETSLGVRVNRGEEFPVTIARQPSYVDKVIIHPAYEPGSATEVDLALLRLSEELTFPQPLKLHDKENELGRVVTLLGWGFFGLGTTGRDYDNGKFRFAHNRITEASRRLVFTFENPMDLGSNALEFEGVPGLGDSGGPALLESEQGITLAGVAVGELMREGYDRASQGKYGAVVIYERLTQHRGWIEQVISYHQPLNSGL